jgi:hypothetical protein
MLDSLGSSFLVTGLPSMLKETEAWLSESGRGEAHGGSS